MADKKTRILIVGGGFGGLYTALHLEKTLARDPDVEVTLVNRENFFLFTPMLHEVAASDLDMTHIVNPVRKLLRRVRFFEGDVESIDLASSRVHVSHGQEHHHHELEYDHLVIARWLNPKRWKKRPKVASFFPTRPPKSGRCRAR